MIPSPVAASLLAMPDEVMDNLTHISRDKSKWLFVAAVMIYLLENRRKLQVAG